MWTLVRTYLLLLQHGPQNCCQLTVVMFQRALWWDAEAAGLSCLMVFVQPRYSTTVYLVSVDQVLLTAMMPDLCPD